MKLFIFIVTSIFSISTLINAQSKTNTSITGKVFDNSTKQPLEYATVSVINKKSGKTINGSITDAQGKFVIPGIPSGIYKINIDFIGYQSSSVDSISINTNTNAHPVSLGTIFISSTMLNLQGVVVSGEKPVIENKIDKIVYNASNDVTSQGGLAVDVLKKVPEVTVDIDGNVELQGNSNIRFLINGKPSTVFGSSISDALASIPASQIKSVEAITIPGAKYDSQGTGGIINIILKENNMQGVNGNINLSAGTRLENGSANFNIRRKNFGVNAFFGGRALLKSQVPGSQTRVSTDTTTKQITTLSQDGITDSQRDGFRSGVGFDWNISKNDDITGSLGYNQYRNLNSGLTNQEQIIKDYSGNMVTDILNVRNSDSHSRYSSVDWSLNYKKKFKKEGQELDILYNKSNGKPHTDYTQTQTYSGQSIPYHGSASVNPGTDNETNISIDYTHPVNKNFLVETGAKTSIQNIRSIADVSDFSPVVNQYISDPLQSYQLKYKENVYAGYLSTTFNLLQFLNIKSGVRYEYTDVKIDFPNTNIPSYGTIVPTVVFSHNFNKNQSLKLAYSKRIERPEYRELNPFINLSDPYNITTGNPLLKPEIGNNFELGLNTGFKKGGNIYISLLEHIDTQNVTQLTTFYPTYVIGDSTYTNVSVSSRQNIGREYNSGFTASGSYPVTSHFTIRGNLLITHRYIVSDLSTGNISTGFRTRLSLNANYQLPKDLVFEVFGFYSSASRNIQGKIPQFFIYNFAFRKLFWNKNASFGFTTTNLFSKYIKQVTTISTENSTANNISQRPFRSFGINLTYKFGKLEFKKNEDEDNNMPSPENY